MLLSFLVNQGQVPKVKTVNVFMTLDIRDSDGLIHQQGKLNLFSVQMQRCGSGAQAPFCSKHGGLQNKFVALQCLQRYLLCSLP